MKPLAPSQSKSSIYRIFFRFTEQFEFAFRAAFDRNDDQLDRGLRASKDGGGGRVQIRIMTQAASTLSKRALSTTLVDEVLRSCPRSAEVFIHRRMHCVGCPIASFHSVEEACSEHGQELDGFVAELQAAMAASSSSGES